LERDDQGRPDQGGLKIGAGRQRWPERRREKGCEAFLSSQQTFQCEMEEANFCRRCAPAAPPLSCGVWRQAVCILEGPRLQAQRTRRGEGCLTCHVTSLTCPQAIRRQYDATCGGVHIFCCTRHTAVSREETQVMPDLQECRMQAGVRCLS
jgi:hypothetical protein